MTLGMGLSSSDFKDIMYLLNKSQKKQLLSTLKGYSEILFNMERPGQRKNQR